MILVFPVDKPVPHLFLVLGQGQAIVPGGVRHLGELFLQQNHPWGRLSLQLSNCPHQNIILLSNLTQKVLQNTNLVL